MPGAPLSREELIGLAEIAKARRRLVVAMFTGTRLTFGKLEALKAGKDLLGSGKKVHSAASQLGKGAAAAKTAGGNPLVRKAAGEFLATCADVPGVEDIVAAIGSETTANLVAEITPFVGLVVSGGKLLAAGKKVAEDGYNLYRSKEWKKGFLRGDPVAAAEAVQALIRRDLARHSVQLGQQAAATGAKIAGLFADLGTATNAAIGTANALASLGLKLAALGLDIHDLRAGNARLDRPDDLDLTVFESCPILGCYLITCADTSLVANFFVADIGLPGWMDRVETMKRKQMDPMLKLASKNIQASRLQLDGLQANKGVHAEKSFFAKMKSKAIKRLGVA